MHQDRQSISVPFYYTLLVNGVCTIVADFFAYPFFVIWSQQHSVGNERTPSFARVVRAIGYSKGFRGFYSGFSVSLISTIPSTLLYLIGKDIPLYCLGDSHLGHFMRGPCARAFDMIVSAPATRLMMLQQASGNPTLTNNFNELSIYNKAKSIFKKGGILNFYRGAFPCFCAGSLLDGIGFWLQAQVIKLYSEERRTHIAPQVFATTFSFGMAAFMVTPIEGVVTRLRIAESNPGALSGKAFYAEAKAIYCHLGVRGFFRGTPASVAHEAVWFLILPGSELTNEYVRMAMNQGH